MFHYCKRSRISESKEPQPYTHASKRTEGDEMNRSSRQLSHAPRPEKYRHIAKALPCLPNPRPVAPIPAPRFPECAVPTYPAYVCLPITNLNAGIHPPNGKTPPIQQTQRQNAQTKMPRWGSKVLEMMRSLHPIIRNIVINVISNSTSETKGNTSTRVNPLGYRILTSISSSAQRGFGGLFSTLLYPCGGKILRS